MNKENQFPVCPTSEIIELVEMEEFRFIVTSVAIREAAINAPRGDIRLGYSPACGHTYNLDFDPSLMEYTQEYENSLHFHLVSGYATALAGASREICFARQGHRGDRRGKGDFLIMLCATNGNRGWG